MRSNCPGSPAQTGARFAATISRGSTSQVANAAVTTPAAANRPSCAMPGNPVNTIPVNPSAAHSTASANARPMRARVPAAGSPNLRWPMNRTG